MLARRDAGMEGSWKRGGIKERRDSGMEGFRTGGIQERRATRKQERRVQDIRYEEQERSWTGGIQERWNAGQVGFRTVEMQEKRDARKEGCRKAGVQESRGAGTEG